MPNHLIHETSPYLLQHAGNPVNWYPWSSAAFERAQAENKPILLSIGYSACHWCHVMAHESFEDEEVAAVMNTHFINIKADREERPDLDQIYQNAHYLLTRRSGGWPLTVFLMPDGTPFYSGTYFPKQARYGLPGFPDLLRQIARVYQEKRPELAAQNEQLIAALHAWQPGPAHGDAPLDDVPLTAALQQLLQDADRKHGGFGGAPKFPHPTELNLLLQQGNGEACQIALFTLQQMALGGLYDQLGGGFYRYSVDALWDIPHFEKMLYDNGLLLGLYSDAWQVSRDPLFARIVEQSAAWVMREMQLPQGAYCTSLDADSEHEEGKFYLWQRNEIQDLLSNTEYTVVAAHHGLDGPPNFEHHAWHLRIHQPLSTVAQTLGLTREQTERQLAAAHAKLFAARERRVRPGRDDKVLGSWNGLMIAGMAKAARIFGREDWLRSAQRAMDFVCKTLWQDGRLYATHKDGKTHLNAYLDDHAFLIWAALELMQAAFRPHDLTFAVQLADALLEHFEDPECGGFYFTRHDHEALIQRNKSGLDNAMPSGNGIAAQALLRLGELTGDKRYRDAAERCLRLFSPLMQQAPAQCCSLVAALVEWLKPPSLLVLCGDENETTAWRKTITQHYAPHLMVIALAGNEQNLPQTLAKPNLGKTAAWLCCGTQCLPPLTDLDTLQKECGRLLQITFPADA